MTGRRCERADAAPAGRVERVLDRDVVVDEDRRDLDAVRELDRGLEVQHVAGVVLHDREHAGAVVDGLDRCGDLVRGR